jgi:hypothetical protein
LFTAAVLQFTVMASRKTRDLFARILLGLLVQQVEARRGIAAPFFKMRASPD